MSATEVSPAAVLAALKEPFKASEIHWRVGASNKKKVVEQTKNKFAFPTKGLPLAYIDARDVMKRLDDVMGFDNWQDKYTETTSGRLICCLSLRINGEWLTKSDGAGDTGTEGEKGAISDAFKRAGVKWGVGRYLYYLPSAQWIDLGDRGQIIKPPQLPGWALPKDLAA